MPSNEEALRAAAGKGDTPSVVALLKAGTNPNCLDVDKWTPLHWAARNNSLDAAKVLLAHGADVNTENKGGRTPLAYAKNKPEMKALLLQHGGK